MALTQTNDPNDIQITVDLWDTVNSQVLPSAIAYTIPLTYAAPYTIAGTEEHPTPGTDALLAALKSFFQGADYSWYGMAVQFHAFRATLHAAVTSDISPA